MTCEPVNGREGEEHEGLYLVHRCPASLMTTDVIHANEARIKFQTAGTLPAKGGWLDQAASFVAFVEQFDGEASRIRRILADRAEQKRLQNR